MNYWLLVIPVVSGIIGWLGTWIAAKVFLYRIIPHNLQSVAEKTGKAASAAFSFAELEKKIIDPDNVKKIMPVVEEHVDDFLRNRLKEKMPVIGMFIGNKTIDSLKEIFLKEIEDLFPQVLKQFSGNLQNEFDIETMIADKITNVSAAQWEEMLAPALRYFQIMGAVTGFLIGVINWIIFFIIK
jgi:uncharacterized membrane protein YheB (UPF0754 family)